MKNAGLLIIGLLMVTLSNAQDINQLINVKEVERIEKFLSSDDLQGRKPFTPGIEKAAAFIAAEFAASGLQTWNNSKTYLQEFEMVRPRFISAECSFDQVTVDTRDVIVVTCQPELNITEQSGYERATIPAGANLFVGSFQVDTVQ